MRELVVLAARRRQHRREADRPLLLLERLLEEWRFANEVAQTVDLDLLLDEGLVHRVELSPLTPNRRTLVIAVDRAWPAHLVRSPDLLMLRR